MQQILELALAWTALWTLAVLLYHAWGQVKDA
jgi:hypothetical protein